MISLDLLLTVFLSVTYSVLAIITIVSNFRKAVNIRFALFLISALLWIATLYLYYHASDPSQLLFLGRINFAAGSLLAGTLFLFVSIYPENKEFVGKVLFIIISAITLLISGIAAFTNLVSEQELIGSIGHETVFGSLYLVYVIYIFMFMLGAIVLLIHKYRTAKDIKTKLLLRYLLLALFISIVWGITTNIVLPGVFSFFDLQQAGPLGTVLFSIVVVYSIIRHRFLDVRLLIGRIVYYLTITSLPYGMFFALVAAYTALFGGIFNPAVYFVSIFVALGFVLLFNKLNELIRTQVNSRLINPGYNPLETAEKLSNDLSVMIDLPKIAEGINALIGRTIRPNYSSVVVFADADHAEDRVFSSNPNLKHPNIKALKTMIATLWQATGKHPIVVDEIEGEMLDGIYRNVPNIAKEIKPAMEELGCKVILSVGEQETNLGIYIIGQKEADSPYTTSDLEFLKSIANTGALAIQRSLLYSEVQEFANTLQIKVDQATAELQKTNKDLEATLSQLQEVRRQERDMIDVMGHELRTPISIVRNAIVMMERMQDKTKGELKQEDLKKYLDMSLESTRREITLIETLLSATKVDNARIQLYFVKSDMVDMVDDAIEGQKAPIAQKSLSVTYDRPTEPIWVYADRTRAQEIMDNFLSNAVKYTLQGSVVIKTWKDTNFGWTSVTDTGIGISEEDLQNLGKKFFRAKQHIPKTNGSSTEVIRPGGTGLGLYVTFDLIKIMGGSLYINSKVGQGTTFTYSLPLYTNQPEKQVDQTFDNTTESAKANVYLNQEAPQPPAK